MSLFSFGFYIVKKSTDTSRNLGGIRRIYISIQGSEKIDLHLAQLEFTFRHVKLDVGRPTLLICGSLKHTSFRLLQQSFCILPWRSCSFSRICHRNPVEDYTAKSQYIFVMITEIPCGIAV